MSIVFQLEGRVFWQEQEGDGSRCSDCGDPCYLKQFRVVADVGFKASALSHIESDIVLCGSCADCHKVKDGSKIGG